MLSPAHTKRGKRRTSGAALLTRYDGDSFPAEAVGLWSSGDRRRECQTVRAASQEGSGGRGGNRTRNLEIMSPLPKVAQTALLCGSAGGAQRPGQQLGQQAPQNQQESDSSIDPMVAELLSLWDSLPGSVRESLVALARAMAGRR